ncbi:tryptophan--tRNA ligase [bacterium]|nr:tryptophan--tRNA ligase [bacterium]
MKKLFTGLQPSGDLHIGNYFGALKPAIDLAKQYDSMICVVDLHALTTVKNGDDLRKNTISVTKDFIAAGLDPEKTIIFQQSQVQEHTELAWIFECLVSVPFLMQAHAYKDKVAKGIEASAGLFNYPMLMAADILLYETDIVPVGADQRQHVEYAREAAAKFNNAYGQTFKEAEERILESVAVVPGTDGKKMSKSYGNTIPLFGTKDEIAKSVMSIMTDSAGERPAFVYAMHLLFKTKEELEPLYEAYRGKYKALKDALVEDIDAAISPMREKRDSISDADVIRILKVGSEQARERAQAKMKEVRQKIGLSL